MIKRYFFFIATVCIFAACGTEQKSESERTAVVPDTLIIDRFTELVSTESGLLAMPMGIVPLSEGEFAILDGGMNSAMVFDSDGNKRSEFGGRGSGPGEWEMHPSGLNYKDGTFLVFNSGRFLFNLYDDQGQFISSAPAKRFMSISNFSLLPENNLLVNTNGNEDALAIVIDLDNESEIIKRIGTPTGELADIRDIESERQALADGIIPAYAKNTALVEYDEDGYWLFMNGLGELRYYSLSGDLILTTSIPESITKPIFEHVVKMNREEARPHTVFSLNYAFSFHKHGNEIFILTGAYRDFDDVNQHLLVYSTDGELNRHYVIAKDENKSVLYDFYLSDSDELIVIEVMNARILKKGL